MVSLIPEETLARLKLRFGTRFQSFSRLEVQVLVTADLEGWVDNARMRQITSEHSADMTRLLQKLVSKGILAQDRSGRWARYQLSQESTFAQMEVSSAHHSAHHSAHIEQVSNNEIDELSKVAEKIRLNKHASYKEIEEALIKLCQNKWLTRNQIAKLIGRHPNGLRYRYLTPMVELGLLSLRYPESPTHVLQAYISTSAPE